LERAAAHDQSQELRQQLLQLLEEKQLQLETFQQEILLIERTMLLLSPSNENQTFLCVLVLIFVEALDGITHLSYFVLHESLLQMQICCRIRILAGTEVRKVRLSVF